MAGITCPSCGGKMVFHIPGQNLKCPSCGTTKEIAEYAQNNEAEQQKDTLNTIVYTCRNCGAELIAPDEQAVAYCSYCGSEAMLSGKYEDVIRPKKILPFKKSKKQAKNEYEAALKGKLYVPKEFKQSEFLQGFRGIYLPYYSYEAVIPEKRLELEGTKRYTRGSYDYKETYRINAELGGVTTGVKYDASIAFDDTIANEIAPFDSKLEVDYNDAYLAGFYADKATTEYGNYIEYATEDALDGVYKEIKDNSGGVNVNELKNLEDKKAEIGIDSFNCEVTMYPVWFLTWRHKNRVAYSVMNGQSGKIAMDIPVDKKKFFLISLIIAAAVFVLLSLLPVFIIPKTLAGIASIILLISSIVLEKEIIRIYEKENHVYDYGDTSHAVKKKRIKATGSSKTTTKKTPSGLGCMIIFFVYVGAYAVVGAGTLISALVSGLSSSGALIFFFGATLVIQSIFSAIMVSRCRYLENKSVLIPAFFAPLALLFGLLVALYNPAHDYWYYGATLACLVGLVLNSLTAINYFNYLTTRPVPNFYTREGADNEA